MRVQIDVTKRLIRGKLITIEGSESRWVQFKPERLPNFCYWCGLLSHALRDCPLPLVIDQQGEEHFQYGAWMRGDPTRWFQKDSINHGGGANKVHKHGVIEGGLEKPFEPFELSGKLTGIEKLRFTDLNALLKMIVTWQG